MYDNEEDITTMNTIKITNTLMFGLVMSKPENCKEMIQRVLGIKIKELKIDGIDREKDILKNVLERGARLDIYAEDVEGTAYNIEMQVYTSTAEILARRSRFYLSRMDSMPGALEKGEDFDKLRNTYIIFVCTYDPFGLGFGKYEFGTFCIEDKNLELKDGARRIFLNTKGNLEKVSTELANVLKYIKDGSTNDEYTEVLEADVTELQSKEKVRYALMTFQTLMRDAKRAAMEAGEAKGRKEGRAEGEEKGRKEGEAKGRKEGEEKGRKEGRAEGELIGMLRMACDLVKDGTYTIQKAAARMSMSVEEFLHSAQSFAIEL